MLNGQKFFPYFLQKRSAGFLAGARAKEASGSFLKKRTKKLLLLSVLVVPVSCATPPAADYVAGGTARTAGAVSAGQDTAGEACTRQPSPDGGADIYCGDWDQPSAHLRPVPAAPLAELAAELRASLAARFDCEDPGPPTPLEGGQALVMACTRRVGGWPYAALVTVSGSQAWMADGVRPAIPVMARAIATLSGRAPAPGGDAAATDPLLARRLAARAFSSGDIGQYETLMQAGAQANQQGDFVGAEAAYRAAAALQEKALGPDDANLCTALMSQAVQLSDQGRFAEADAVFARARRLAALPGLSDDAARPRLLHYEGLHLLNQGKDAEALPLLDQAEAGYLALLPADTPTRPVQVAAAGGPAAALAGQFAAAGLVADPVANAALLGAVEVLRNEAVALRRLGRTQQAAAALQLARQRAVAAGLEQPVVAARLDRTAGLADAAAGNPTASLAALAAAVTAFGQALPGSRPVAETELLRAGQLEALHRDREAVASCHNATVLLRSLRTGARAALVQPCLDALAQQASADPHNAQTLLAEMFETAQLAQGGVTSQQIAQASARLQASAHDPKVADAIRRRQDTAATLAELYRERDALAAARRASVPGAAGIDQDALDKRIAEAQAQSAEADQILQAAAPNYGQLVQQVVPASAVLALLHPGEAFAATALGDHSGWSFLLHDGQIAIGPIPGGADAVDPLVHRLRASVEPRDDGTPPPFDAEASQTLYRTLFAGLPGGAEHGLDGITALSVAPSGTLLSIPFALLLTGPAGADLARAPWLVQRVVIAHVPAPANFVSLRRTAGGSRATRPWFGFGDFHPIPLALAQRSFPAATCADAARLLSELPALPGAHLELDYARKLEGAAPTDELLGTDFTAPAVLKVADLRNYRILHFATHALLPTDLSCEAEPAIVTSVPAGATDASGALLTASDVAGLNLDADAVILSACNSGGPNGATAGESLSGLARSFFYAGARSLLVTHWSVNDRLTAYIVALTLNIDRSRPEAGMAAALAGAERSLLAAATGDKASLAHPFYWAPLALIGEGGAVPARTAGL
jgi:CHAT domain-containing protein